MELDQVISLDNEVVELYRVFWPPDPLLVQSRAGLALAVLSRRSAGGGVLLALPTALVPVGSLPLEPDEHGTIGAHCKLEVPGVRLVEDGVEHLGVDFEVLLVDVGTDGLAAMSPISGVPESEDEGVIGFGEDLDVIPDPVSLLRLAREWIAVQTSHRVAFYSAEEEMVPETPGGVGRTALGITPPQSPGKGKGKPKEAAKPKRVTTAVLAEQMNQMMETLPVITQQLGILQQNQKSLQDALELQKTTPPVRASQLPVSGVAQFAKMMGSPPRTKAHAPMLAPQPTRTSGLDAGLSLQEQAEEASPVPGDPYAKAMLEQSRALMTLASAMQQGGDPLLDMPASSSSSSLSTRGSIGREKLQRELAMKSGSFYLAVLQNAVKRLKPACPRPSSVEEVAATDFSMIQYLERFGGYGSFKELGLIQYALAHIFDALVHSDLNGGRDYLSLLMVGVDQANLDGNRWELAYRMMLLEEPPSQLWSYRSQGFDPRSKSFSPLAHQQWTTVALAYSKEMDYIQTKRQEMTTKPKANGGAPQAANPKRKGKFPQAKAGTSSSTPTDQVP